MWGFVIKGRIEFPKFVVETIMHRPRKQAVVARLLTINQCTKCPFSNSTYQSRELSGCLFSFLIQCFSGNSKISDIISLNLYFLNKYAINVVT